MGTSVSLHLADDFDHESLIQLADEAFSWLRLVEQRFSPYQPGSEVSRLRRDEMCLAECSSEVRAVIDRCAQLWAMTDGYFDAYATGALDPSGFVKGWAVQVASDRLLAAGCANHCINAGSDVRMRGRPVPGQPWRVGIRHPQQGVGPSWIVSGTDIAVATSGIYERGCRVVNPHEGRPSMELQSVTVVGADLGLADAYATAGAAMGMPALTWLAGLPDHEAAVITEDARCFRSDGLPTID
ncbi:MAG: FAD:protein FMN transferase [Dactylosporangium sp.]|nr:FAD:protein FMN transferase [Dactylosporangium sp.]NNJ60262.1 FAD:protein FMN transferase [Dactylosporangium sp.]